MLSPTKKRRVSSSHNDQTVAAGAPAANAPAPPAAAAAAPNAAAGGGYHFAGNSIPHGRMSVSPSISRNPYRDSTNASNNYNIGRGEQASAKEIPPNDCTMMDEDDDDGDDFDLSQVAEIAPVTAAMASLDIGG